MTAKPTFTLTVNGATRTVAAPPDTPLLWVLRDILRLTGTKYGCGVGVCGACTIHEDGRTVRACQVPLAATTDKGYVTIEGLSAAGDHPCQTAWLAEDVAQCGFCQPGMIMTAAALLDTNPAPDEAAIDAALADSVCRCGTYLRIKAAIRRAANPNATDHE